MFDLMRWKFPVGRLFGITIKCHILYVAVVVGLLIGPHVLLHDLLLLLVPAAVGLRCVRGDPVLPALLAAGYGSP